MGSGVGDQRQQDDHYEFTNKGFLICNYESILRDSEHLASWSKELTVLDEANASKTSPEKVGSTTLAVHQAFLFARREYPAGSSSPSIGLPRGTRDSAASNFAFDARLARSCRYSSVIRAASFSAAAELIN